MSSHRRAILHIYHSASRNPLEGCYHKLDPLVDDLGDLLDGNIHRSLKRVSQNGVAAAPEKGTESAAKNAAAGILSAAALFVLAIIERIW